MVHNGMRPVRPGEVLREDYLIPLGLTASALAKALNVPASRINEIVQERRAVTLETALRLARYFGGDAYLLFPVIWRLLSNRKAVSPLFERACDARPFIQR